MSMVNDAADLVEVGAGRPHPAQNLGDCRGEKPGRWASLGFVGPYKNKKILKQ
jgi:hypothetical protein